MKRQFALEQATERVLECKKAAAMASVVLETASEDNERSVEERADAIAHASKLLEQQQGSCDAKAEELTKVQKQTLTPKP